MWGIELKTQKPIETKRRNIMRIHRNSSRAAVHNLDPGPPCPRCPRCSSPPPSTVAAGQTGDDHVEEGDDAVDDCFADRADGIDDAHETGTDGVEDALDLLPDVRICF